MLSAHLLLAICIFGLRTGYIFVPWREILVFLCGASCEIRELGGKGSNIDGLR